MPVYDSKALIEKRKSSVIGLISILLTQARSTKGGSLFLKNPRLEIKKFLLKLGAEKHITNLSKIQISDSINKIKSQLPLTVLKRHKSNLICYQKPVTPFDKVHPKFSEFSPSKTLEAITGKIKNAKVFGPTLAVCDENWTLVRELSRDWGKTIHQLGIMKRLSLPSKKTVAGDVILGAILGGETYFHWMTEGLPLLHETLKAMKSRGIKPSAILFHAKTAKFHKDTMNVIGLRNIPVFPIQKKAYYECENIYFTSPKIISGRVSKAEINLLRSIYLSPKIRSVKTKRIAILRNDAKSRGLIHFAGIANLLLRFDFELYEPSQFSVRDQAKKFFEAKTIVATHGAALTNLIFCRPGTTVVELFSARYVNPCYAHICRQLGLRHIPVLDQSASTGANDKVEKPTVPIGLHPEELFTVLAEIGLETSTQSAA
jgi:capsular polysaccharide biosynthesis protein